MEYSSVKESGDYATKAALVIQLISVHFNDMVDVMEKDRSELEVRLFSRPKLFSTSHPCFSQECSRCE